MNKLRYILVVLLSVSVCFGLVISVKPKILTNKKAATLLNKQTTTKIGQIILPTPSPTNPTLTPIPTQKPLTFEEMNQKYGPCAIVNVLMYHHIQPNKESKEKKQTSLSVDPENFKKHLEYLKEKGYNSISVSDLAVFLNGKGVLPKNPVILTFDDGYLDNYTFMYPILKESGFKATIFLSTGLMNNPDYLSWDQINEMNQSGLVYFGNHTWSHQSSKVKFEVLQKEIGIADTQLNDRNLNTSKIFAYPYGPASSEAMSVLEHLTYQIAFTTSYGKIMCQGKRFELPRIRASNAPLKNIGL